MTEKTVKAQVEPLLDIAELSHDTPLELLNVPAGHAAQMEKPKTRPFVIIGSALFKTLYPPKNTLEYVRKRQPSSGEGTFGASPGDYVTSVNEEERRVRPT
jgi:hypothetical protein